MIRWLSVLLAATTCSFAATALADWTQSPTRAWQEGDTIHAMGFGGSEEEATSRARQALVTAIEEALPDLESSLAAGAAVPGDRVVKGDMTYVRLDFPARYGNACRTAHAWLKRGDEARKGQRGAEALEAFAQAAIQQPLSSDTVGALGLQLADEGYWASAATLLDAAATALPSPPLSLLRNSATTHIWMGDTGGARRAIERLRTHDPYDPGLDELEAMLLGIRSTPIRMQELEVMPWHSRALDAQLVVRFAVWAMMDGATRRALLVRDLEPGDFLETVVLGGVEFEGLRGTVTGDDALEVTGRDRQTWRFEATEIEDGRSCLELSAVADPPGSLADEARNVELGGPFPIHRIPGAGGLTDGWLRPMYATGRGGEDRILMVLHVRGGGRTFRIDLSGPLGTEQTGRPGMLTCPQLVQMALDGLVVSGGDPR